MTKTYKINLKNQFYSIRSGLILLSSVPIGLVILNLTGQITRDDYLNELVVLLVINLVFFLPAFYLHFSYYLHNRNTTLTVDDQVKRISIKSQNQLFDLTFDDISFAEQHVGIYYKNKIDNRRRFLVPWSDYSYLKLKLKNGQIFYFSSLMIDVQNSPFPISHTNYRLIPFIEREETPIAELRNGVEEERKFKYNTYLENFASLSLETLQEKVSNSKHYEPEAIAAAKTLIERSVLSPNADLKQQSQNESNAFE